MEILMIDYSSLSNSPFGAAQRAPISDYPRLVRIPRAPDFIHEMGHTPPDTPFGSPLPSPRAGTPAAEGAGNAVQHAFREGRIPAGSATPPKGETPAMSPDAIDQTIEEVVQAARAYAARAANADAIDRTIEDVIQAARQYYGK
jgi:hypothetical protein|uniref:Uncharacterized protein n=2 Tax=Phyllobacteriaceae TaxID=69277 RepID=Q11JV9_CHESB